MRRELSRKEGLLGYGEGRSIHLTKRDIYKSIAINKPVNRMKKGSLKNLAVTLLVLALAVSVIPPPSSAAEPEKVVFSRWYNYTPPPTGHWNPFVAGSISLLSVVQESLTHYYQANASYVPGLAENWTYENYMVFTLKLRKGVKWHDGTDFTTRDVWATWYNLYLLKDRAWYYLRNITIVDNQTMIFYMSEKNDYVPFYILWHWVVVPYSDFGALATKVYNKIQEGNDIIANSTPFNDLINELKALKPATPIGTGPYKFKSISETEMVLEKNTNYWRAVPDIDEVRYVRVLDANVGWQMLSEGQFSYHWAIPTKEQHKLMVGKPWVKIVPIARGNCGSLYFNNRPTIDGEPNPLGIKEVRQAIAYGLNRTELAAIEYPAGGSTSKYCVGFNNAYLYQGLNQTFIDTWLKDFTYDYNPTKAKQLLESIGCVKDIDGIYKTSTGQRLDFVIKSSGWLSALTLDAISAQLALIGIKTTGLMVDTAVFFAVPNGDFYQGRYQIAASVLAGIDFTFDEVYNKYRFIYPGHGLPELQNVPWLTSPVNLSTSPRVDYNYAKYMQTAPVLATRQERLEMIAVLSYITASQVPVLNIVAPTAYAYINTQQFAGWPDWPADDLYWRGLGTYEAHGSSYLHRWLMLKPYLNLTISASPAAGGTTSPAAGTIRYAKGTTVNVTATPASGYTLRNWILDGVNKTGATITVTMDAAHTLQAIFIGKQSLTISVTPTEGGTTTPATGTYSYAYGDAVTVTVTPASWYTFKNWVLDGVSVAGTSITVTMDRTHTLQAVLERMPIELYIGGVAAVIVVIVVLYFVLRRR